MKPRIIFIHGWKTRGKSLREFASRVEALGHEIVFESYGFVMLPWTTRERSRDEAKRLSTIVRPGDVVVGHSNGGRIARDLSFLTNGDVKRMVWLYPALNKSAVPGKGVEHVLVVHSRSDMMTWLAGLIPGSDWGRMGNVGYQPRKGTTFDKRMISHEVLRGGHDGHMDAVDFFARLISDFATLPSEFLDEVSARESSR